MLNPFATRADAHALAVRMVDVKMGDRFLQVGCAHGGRFGAVAAKVGLSGSAAAIAPDERSAIRARKGAAAAGVLVDVTVAPPMRLPADDGAFDVAVVDDTAGLLGALDPADRTTAASELFRILRPGGRALVIGAARRRGLAALLPRPPVSPQFLAAGGARGALEAAGFKSVRVLAEREGLSFVEGLKGRA
jgi:ubiquinone/menaquinone biosynthesis C-methylase UbiE